MTHNANNPLRVLLVDDSRLTLQMLQRGLSRFEDIRIVGTAGNGVEALERLGDTEVDILCTDLHMPVMDGVELTRRVMQEAPLPVLVISISVGEDDKDNVFRLIDAGAVDVFEKPRGGLDAENLPVYEQLAQKIRVVGGVPVIRRAIKSRLPPPRPRPTPHLSSRHGDEAIRILAVGASTGGPLALKQVLSELPEDYPFPIVVVQHIGMSFLPGLLGWLDDSTRLKVSQAIDGARPRPGNVYFASRDQHLGFDTHGCFQYHSGDPAGGGHRPSIDVLFQATSRCYGAACCGVLLTGMGMDGAAGMAAIQAAGGSTIAESEETAVVFGMPKAAIAINAADQVLPLPAIGPALASLGRNLHHRKAR